MALEQFARDHFAAVDTRDPDAIAARLDPNLRDQRAGLHFARVYFDTSTLMAQLGVAGC